MAYPTEVMSDRMLWNDEGRYSQVDIHRTGYAMRTIVIVRIF